MSENGIYGLRQTNDGMLITDNGADAKPKWFGMFPGLIHAGVVYDGMPGGRWSAPGAGVWASRKQGDGNYLVTFSVACGAYAVLVTNTYSQRYASVASQSSTGFNVLTADDNTPNGSNFYFFVINTEKWLW